MANRNRAGKRTQRTDPIEIILDESDSASLQHATSTLRWLLAKTERGWEHAAVDPEQCKRWAARLEEIHYESRAQLRRTKTAEVHVSEADAALLRQFIDLVKRIEPGAFAELVSQLARITAAIDPPNRRADLRRRPSSLSEP